MDEVYLKYYQSQAGNGLGDIGQLYHISPKYYQRGRGGIGSFFSGIFRHLKPLMRSGLHALKKQSLKTGVNILKDLGQKPIKDIFIEEGKAAVDDLAQKGIKKLQKMQNGKGTAHSFTFKNSRSIKRQLPMSSHQSSIPIKKKRTIYRKKPKNKKEQIDIFTD